MGQTVSYILRCICCEAEEEEWSNDQNLQTYPLKSNSCSNSNSSEISRLVSPPSLLSCNSSSTNNVAKHRFMVNHSDILVSDENTQFYTQIGNACSNSSNIDQALQPNHKRKLQPDCPYFAPPIPILFPSIDPSSNELLYGAPSTVVPSIDSSSGTMLHEVFVDTSTYFPSINSSTDEALLHELVVAPSTFVPSINMSNDQALFHELFIDPSTDVSSIFWSIDELFQLEAFFRSMKVFKGTDSNLQAVEDKMQVYPPNNESLKTTKERSEEESKEAKPGKEAAAVVIERKIKHYSSSQKMLLVGEGDFSFSACLAMSFGSASNIVATSLDSTEFLRANYKNAMSNICELRSKGGKVMHGVDATEMACNCLINDSVYDRVIYNFPHDGFFQNGFFQNESRNMQLKSHRGLIVKFFENAKELISADGEIHISHKSYGFFLEWNLQLLASNVGLRLIEEVPFDLKDYKGYNTKYGFGGDKNFDCNPSKTYKFGFKTRKPAI